MSALGALVSTSIPCYSIHSTGLLDDHRVLDPPDPIPNSAVKQYIADGSVGFPHVRVGHRQALYKRLRSIYCGAFFYREIDTVSLYINLFLLIARAQ